MSLDRSETQFAADIVILLLVSGVIDKRRWSAHQLAVTVGCSLDELEDSRRRQFADGLDSLMPDGGPSRTEDRVPRKPERRPPPEHPGERKCLRCGEWLPIDEFVARTAGDPRPLDGYRRSMCPVCFGEFERGHFIAVKQAMALKEIVAFFTAERPDEVLAQMCWRCERPIEYGDHVELVGMVSHTKCDRGNR